MAKKKTVSKKAPAKKVKESEPQIITETIEEGAAGTLEETFKQFLDMPVPEKDSNDLRSLTALSGRQGWVVIMVKSAPGQLDRQAVITTLLEEVLGLSNR